MSDTKPTPEMIRACCELMELQYVIETPSTGYYMLHLGDTVAWRIRPDLMDYPEACTSCLAVQVLAKLRTIEYVEDYSYYKKGYCVCGMGFNKDEPVWEWPEIEHDGTAESWVYAVLKAGAEVWARGV